MPFSRSFLLPLLQSRIHPAPHVPVLSPMASTRDTRQDVRAMETMQRTSARSGKAPNSSSRVMMALAATSTTPKRDGRQLICLSGTADPPLLLCCSIPVCRVVASFPASRRPHGHKSDFLVERDYPWRQPTPEPQVDYIVLLLLLLVLLRRWPRGRLCRREVVHLSRPQLRYPPV